MSLGGRGADVRGSKVEAAHIERMEVGRNSLEGDDMVARLDARDALADGLDDAGSLVAQDDWKRTLGVLAGEGICICGGENQPRSATGCNACKGDVSGLGLTCVTDSGVVDFDSNLVGLGRCDLNVLDAQVFAGLPSHGRLASDGLRGSESQSACFRGHEYVF